MSEEVSIETVRSQSSERTFPCDILAECKTGIAFFCAAFLGRNDVIHLHNHGVSELWLNDVDDEKLRKMGQIYGAQDRLLPGDSYTIAQQFAAANRKFDVVLCDPFTNLMKRTLIDEYDAFAAIADKWFISGASGAMFEEIGIEASAEALTKYLQAQGKSGAHVERLVMRNSDYKNGVYWALLKASGQAGAKKAAAKRKRT